jgi:hypothetical protein
MPVSTTARTPPIVEGDHDIRTIPRDAHMTAARRKIDLAGLDDFPVDRFARRPMA